MAYREAVRMVKDWTDLSVLIVGCGSIGKRHARVLRSLGVADVRACDPSSEQRQLLSAESPNVRMYDCYDAGLRDRPDTVLICTPPEMHVPMACQAIAAGCHVLTEKPLSDTLDGIDELQRLAAASGKKVMVALCFRYHEGLIRSERTPGLRPHRPTGLDTRLDGRASARHSAGLPLHVPCRPQRGFRVDARPGSCPLVRRPAGEEGHCVYGTYSDIGIQSPDVVEFLLDFEDRCMASVHLDFFQSPRRRQMELIGTKGVVTVEFARWDRCTVSLYEAASGSGKSKNWRRTATTCFARKTASFSKQWHTTNQSAAPLRKGASPSKWFSRPNMHTLIN